MKKFIVVATLALLNLSSAYAIMAPNKKIDPAIIVERIKIIKDRIGSLDKLKNKAQNFANQAGVRGSVDAKKDAIEVEIEVNQETLNNLNNTLEQYAGFRF